MNDERDGIDMLRRAIDEVAEGLPERARGRRIPAGASWAVAAACVIGAGAIAVYLRAARPEGGERPIDGRIAAPTSSLQPPAPPGVEVRLLRVNGRDVAPRVFDAARAGTIVVAPEVGREDGRPPAGAAVQPDPPAPGVVVLAQGGSR